MTPQHEAVSFNSPLEAGLRAALLLAVAYPAAFDLQRLVAFDFLLVHTGDVGGPASLHPPTPHRSAEILVRRKIVEDALVLMMTRNLVQRDCVPTGIVYRAGELGQTFLSSMSSKYMVQMKDRAVWVTKTFGKLSDPDFRVIMRRFFEDWVEEFQGIERSFGAKE